MSYTACATGENYKAKTDYFVNIYNVPRDIMYAMYAYMLTMTGDALNSITQLLGY